MRCSWNRTGCSSKLGLFSWRQGEIWKLRHDLCPQWLTEYSRKSNTTEENRKTGCAHRHPHGAALELFLTSVSFSSQAPILSLTTGPFLLKSGFALHRWWLPTACEISKMGGQCGLCGKDVAPDTAVRRGREGEDEGHVYQPAWLRKLLRKMLTKHHEVSH